MGFKCRSWIERSNFIDHKSILTRSHSFEGRNMAPILSLLATCLAAIVVGCTTQAIMIPLPVREYDKLCSPWTNVEHDSISPSSYDQRECSSPLEVEQNDGQTRFCCPARPVGNFPTECGKQLYQPLIQRIVGGMHAIPNSWVSAEEDIHNGSLFYFVSLLAMASDRTQSH